MKTHKRFVSSLAIVVLAFASFRANLGRCDERVTEDAAGKVTLIAADYQFTEGPAVDAAGNVFFHGSAERSNFKDRSRKARLASF